MTPESIRKLLDEVKAGTVSSDDAMDRLRTLPFEDIGFAKIDHHRSVCAGMPGALPSVVGGLVGVPVVAVPTSIGYGASFGGLAALLGCLNSCAPNVAVVNVDNGFGAAYFASMINRQ